MQIPVANYRAAVQTTAIRAASVQVPVNPNPTPVSAFSSGPRGKVTLVNGRAVAPADAPAVVRRVVEAGNRLQDKPYKWGGGHAQLNDDGYDCSGAVSYVLREAGLMKGSTTSKGFCHEAFALERHKLVRLFSRANEEGRNSQFLLDRDCDTALS